MKKLYCMAIGAIVCTMAIAQKNKIAFRTVNSVGLLAGASENAVQLQSINGISYKTFSAGIGIGIDNYYYKSVPLFVDVRKNIFNKKQTPFVYADIGSNLPWKNKEAAEWETNNYNSGLYYDVGIGYTAPVKGRLKFTVSCGYSEKNIQRVQQYNFIIIDPAWPTVWNPEYYDYTFRRLSVKFGLSF